MSCASRAEAGQRFVRRFDEVTVYESPPSSNLDDDEAKGRLPMHKQVASLRAQAR